MSERDDIITELLVLYDEEREEHSRKEYTELLLSCTDEVLAEVHRRIVANWLRQRNPVWMFPRKPSSITEDVREYIWEK